VITLVLGGARSGKSAVAERRVAALAGGRPIACVVTGSVGADDDFRARIEAHRARRPAAWATVEAGADVAGALAALAEDVAVLLDSLGTWLGAQPGPAPDISGLVAALRARTAPVVVVSDEVGLGVHPSSGAGRRFRDALGEVNRAVADAADEVTLVVAGRVLPLARP
jgi:adenosylcobinamide kinase/adenosylcobinamide-phosphate guanylyltransferase